MPYPPSPWYLRGLAFFSLYAIEIETARPFIPLTLEIVSFYPNYTLGGVYIGNYKSGSTLEYSELIIAPAFVRYQNHIGGWVSHIYVDNEDSLRGGREIWGLPKEMAEFHWRDTEINISQQNRTLCNFSYRSPLFPLETWWRPSLEGTVLSRLEDNWLFFQGKFRGNMSLLSSQLEIPSESPFSALKLQRSLVTLRWQDLEFTARSPQIIT
jgi:acetoacetate decarboxylase